MNILKDLNPSQKIAAETFYGPMLILAGAGSGKTKTLITRTANMILNKIEPESILVMTFTNKAAKEMKERGVGILSKLKINTKSPEFTTFHSFCLKFLKKFVSFSSEIESQFTILDDKASKSLLSLVVKDLYKRDISTKEILTLIDALETLKLTSESKETVLEDLNLYIKNSKKKDLKWLEKNKINYQEENDLIKLSTFYFLYKSNITKFGPLTSKDLALNQVYGKENKDISEDNLSAIFSILQNNLVSYKDVDSAYNDIIEMIMTFNRNKKSLQWMANNFVNPSSSEDLKLLAKAFVEYKRILRKNNTVDFDDLINLSIKILQENKDIEKLIKNQYKFIMVDEFQDTNLSQIILLELITNSDNNICVVGDDSQSIYAWRGADINYILNFHKKFKNTKVINLTENYRSTHNIVSRANKLLESAEEKHSLKESLRAFRQDDGTILCSQLFNDKAEGDYVAKEIKKAIRNGVNPNEIAILYRNNFIVDGIEKSLIREHIPYKIFKGRSLLQKKSSIEFMYFINYLLNDKNHFAFEEYISSTLKLVSENNIENIRNYLEKNKININTFFISDKILDESNIKIAKDKLEEIRELIYSIDMIRLLIKDKKDMMEITEEIKTRSLLFEEYERIINTSKSESTIKSAESSLKDLYFILNLMSEYETVELFFEDVTLSSEMEKEENGKINLMTVHASKGLEFEYVFLVRFNNEIFPSKRAMLEPALLEEERRLAYVALTRAKVYLSVTHIMKGFNGDMAPSRFLRESGIYSLNKKIFNEPEKSFKW